MTCATDVSDERQRALAMILAEVQELAPTEAAATLEYIRRLRSVGAARAKHNPRAEVPAGPDEVGPGDDLRPAPEHHALRRAGRVLDRSYPGPSSTDQADVAVRVLGPFDVVVGPTPVRTWGGTRVRTVFQYLLLHPRPVHREVLMELLWAGYPHSSARNNLNVCMYGLRRALSVGEGGRDFVVHRNGYYTLNLDLVWSVDRAKFVKAAERSRQANCEWPAGHRRSRSSACGRGVPRTAIRWRSHRGLVGSGRCCAR